MFKNVASQKAIIYVFDPSTGLPKTGDAANLTAYVSKDFGSVTVLGDTSATEMDATNAKGYYLFDLTQAETNADTLLFSCKSSTSGMVCVAIPATVYTTPANFSTWLTPLVPTVAGRTLDVSATGEAGIDWANVGSPTTTLALTATTIASTATDAIMSRIGIPTGANISSDIATVNADTNDIQTRLPAVLVSGRMDASVGAMAVDVVTASALATNAVTEIQAGLATPTNITSATGVVLAATGLDSVTATPASGTPATLRDMLVWLYRRFGKKFTRDTSDNSGKAYADNGSTVLTTQSLTTSGTVQTQSAVS